MVFLDTWALGQRANGGVSEIRWRGRSAPHCAPNCSQAALTGLVWRCNISRALSQRYRHAACHLRRLPSRSTPKQYVVHMDITNSYHRSRSDWPKTAETSYLMPSHRSTALPLGLPSNVSPAEVERRERLAWPCRLALLIEPLSTVPLPFPLHRCPALLLLPGRMSRPQQALHDSSGLDWSGWSLYLCR